MPQIKTITKELGSFLGLAGVIKCWNSAKYALQSAHSFNTFLTRDLISALIPNSLDAETTAEADRFTQGVENIIGGNGTSQPSANDLSANRPGDDSSSAQGGAPVGPFGQTARSTLAFSPS